MNRTFWDTKTAAALHIVIAYKSLILFTNIVILDPNEGHRKEGGVPQAWAARCGSGPSLAAAWGLVVGWCRTDHSPVIDNTSPCNLDRR